MQFSDFVNNGKKVLGDFGGMSSAANAFTTTVGVLVAPVVTILAPAYASTALTTYAVLHGVQHSLDTFAELEEQNDDGSLSGSAYSVVQALTQGFVVAAVDLTLMKTFVEAVSVALVSIEGFCSASNVEKGYESMHSSHESTHSSESCADLMYEAALHYGQELYSALPSVEGLFSESEKCYEKALHYGQELYGLLEDLYHNAI